MPMRAPRNPEADRFNFDTAPIAEVRRHPIPGPRRYGRGAAPQPRLRSAPRAGTLPVAGRGAGRSFRRSRPRRPPPCARQRASGASARDEDPPASRVLPAMRRASGAQGGSHRAERLSDALVVRGVNADPARSRLLPSLQPKVSAGRLERPAFGLAREDPPIRALIARPREAVRASLGEGEKATSARPREARGPSRWPPFDFAISPCRCATVGAGSPRGRG